MSSLNKPRKAAGLTGEALTHTPSSGSARGSPGTATPPPGGTPPPRWPGGSETSRKSRRFAARSLVVHRCSLIACVTACVTCHAHARAEISTR